MLAQHVISVAVAPKTEDDRERLSAAVRELAKDDTSFDVTIDPESGHAILRGMGEIHLEILVHRLLREHRVEVTTVSRPQILYRGNTEPIMAVEVAVPEGLVSAVLADLRSRRARIEGVEARGDLQVVRAMVPLADMLGYAANLRVMTTRKATFAMHFAHYEERTDRNCR